MIKQLKHNPAFTRQDDDKYEQMSLDYQNAGRNFKWLSLYLSSMNLESDEQYAKYKKFYKERIKSGAHVLHLHFEGLSIDLYQKAFKMIDKLFSTSDHFIEVNFYSLKMNQMLILLILQQFSKFIKICFTNCEIYKSLCIRTKYIIHRQYNIRQLYIRHLVGIGVYEFLEAVSKNTNVKHLLEWFIITMFDKYDNYDISRIIRAKSLGFNRCRLVYDGESSHYLELY